MALLRRLREEEGGGSGRPEEEEEEGGPPGGPGMLQPPPPPAPPPLLPWDRFSAWLHCVCVVGFDLELGQAVEVIYPQHAKLTDKEKTNICYLSFPDSNSGCLGDTQFCFRFRQSSNRKLSWHCLLDQFDRDLPIYLKRDPAYYYGYVYFRQVQDKTLKRGYFQKSLVLISKLPYIHFFHTVLGQIAPEYFDKNDPYLEAACNDVDRWPPPVPGKTLHLPIMGIVIKVRIPTCHDKPGTTQVLQSTYQEDTQISISLPTVHEIDLFRCFLPVFFHIQMLWELVLLGEPLVVMAPSPSESSETVLALVSCISPLKYYSDFRPYFTIHDSEFKEYTTRTQTPPSVILGVTNPFFAKTLQHWPHIIRIGDIKLSGEVPKPVKVKKLKNLKTLDSKPGVYTSYKPYLNRDEEIIKQLQKGVYQKRPAEAQSIILRRYFLELTQSFIIPLERYVASLMPLQKSISPWKDLLFWSQKHTEVETVDLVLKLKDKLADGENLPVKPGTMEKLQRHIDSIILAQPEDLQGILTKTGST
ncbi:protein DENND6A isoform X2 [Sceloporus undulatus]|uniref:protein DENND6A isoform X2 n=1 Tax=Sceloporus undulatus TaxID=8520 RepID=UPI001C4B83C1|nr:protein DENND6A isoform X2 [Sceloporus undulatus]